MHYWFVVVVSFLVSQEELSSNNDGYGYENVFCEVNSPCFKLYPAYSISFNSSGAPNDSFLQNIYSKKQILPRILLYLRTAKNS